MNETTAQNIIELLGKQDERIAKLEQLIKGQQEQLVMLPDYRDSVVAWNKELIELNDALRQIKLPAKEIMDLKNALSENTMIRKNSPEIRHHHYIPKVTLIAAGLFLLLACVSAGWYNTWNKQKEYQAADIKYRYLQLDATPDFKSLLSKTDSIYTNNSALMRQEVIKKERDIRSRLELYRLAAEKEAEAIRLRKKASSE